MDAEVDDSEEPSSPGNDGDWKGGKSKKKKKGKGKGGKKGKDKDGPVTARACEAKFSLSRSVRAVRIVNADAQVWCHSA